MDGDNHDVWRPKKDDLLEMISKGGIGPRERDVGHVLELIYDGHRNQFCLVTLVEKADRKIDNSCGKSFILCSLFF